MKLIKQSYEILTQEIPVRKLDDYSGEHFREQYIDNMYKHIERCGRTCYKSERLITEDSAKRFVEGLIKTKHYSVLEHGAVYLYIEYNPKDKDSRKFISKYISNKYTVFNSRILKVNNFIKPLEEQVIGEPIDVTLLGAYITTNYRVIIENHWEDDLQYLCEPTKYHELRHTVLLHGCIHTYKDLTRHRKASFSIESTRYCNYSKTDKFGEMKFVLPSWVNIETKFIEAYNKSGILPIDSNQYNSVSIFLNNLSKVEKDYNELISLGWQPQQSAEVLPQCTAADIVMTAYDSDWKFIFDLRSDTAATGKPHPLVEELMTPLRDEFKEKGWI